MDVCTICSVSPFRVPLSCGCTSFCQDCIIDWLSIKLELQGVDEEANLICPSGHIGHEVTLEELFDLVKGTEKEESIAQMTLRRSLRSLEGMVFCPREHCDYVGWVKVSEKCSYPLVCELCGSNWRDDQLLPSWKRLLQFISRLLSCQEDSFSLIWKDLWTEACPGCGALIEKNGGCSHMKCAKCNLDFCWTCMRSTRNHDSEICGIRMIVYTVVYVVFGTLFTLKLLWICGIVNAFFTALQTIIMTIGLLGLGAAAIGISADCRCGFIVFILYVLVHIGTILFSEVGWLIFKTEAAVVIAGLHCVLGFSYLKYAN